MNTPPRTGREVRLAARPVGMPAPGDLVLAAAAVPEPAAGEVLVRNLFLSLDAGTRIRMSDVGVPIPLIAVGEVMTGDAVGRVIASASPDLAVGDLVRHALGWREFALANADRFHKVDGQAFPTQSAHLAPALTAWAGLVDVARLTTGETVFVSGAAGAVGGLVGQIARLKGAARVVGSAGSPAKVAHLTGVLGFDAAFDYHDGSPADQLRKIVPGGVDVYFDNAGGAQLEAAIEVMNPHGRIVLCGALASQNGAARSSGPANLILAIAKRLTLRGFLTSDHLHRAPTVQAEMSAWLRAGRLHLDESIVDSLDNAPAAFVDMLRGAYTGKVIIRLAP
ncbi:MULTISPECIES: NADP-dependent oxidoreductase [unclassified Pseudofrankia]|uniref:NADP-dependent oxidoreductase n=1 Tax=unclassified Pseudofrankia TaxID=2994372 RepID=UPI0008D9DE7A|nr:MULTISPECIES: NADP-dependent oxidoreductase [unclassified Pseudofrankia]MDT3442777.1 NADP-dependent oxidoreductase [Pseudofrankia sp. BMG5.37]OHV44227.1 NADP-dependent oxidoreductase [Pseudofrankia sp. BMG5.36]